MFQSTWRAARAVACSGKMDAPADEKARLRIDLTCDNGETVSITMRNLGPDQGMGVGRINETDERLYIFYHPSEEEAERRLVQIKAEIEQEAARVKESLRERVAELAVAGAEKILRREIDAKVHADILLAIEKDL